MKPSLHPSVFVAEGAQIWGDVEIGAGSSVWFGAVIRGDEGKVVIGEDTNIQDNCVIHGDLGLPVVLGAHVTVGHGSVLRACEVGDGTMIGMHSTVMSGVSIGKRCIVGAHSLITYKQTFDDNSLVTGTPAKRVREATDEEKQFSQIACDVYRRLVVEYGEENTAALTKDREFLLYSVSLLSAGATFFLRRANLTLQENRSGGALPE